MILFVNYQYFFHDYINDFIFQVSWVRYRDTSLIAVGKFVYISDNRFKVLHEVNSSDWFLVIKSVTYDDQGIYECQVNSDPYKTFKFHLSVVGEYLGNVFFLKLIGRPHQAIETETECVILSRGDQ